MHSILNDGHHANYVGTCGEINSGKSSKPYIAASHMIAAWTDSINGLALQHARQQISSADALGIGICASKVGHGAHL